MDCEPMIPEGADESDRLVLESLDLVGAIVRELSARFPAHVDRGELWGAGALGLVEAARRFDPATGVPFRRYAAIRIRGAILDQTRRSDWATRTVRRRARRVEEAEAALNGAAVGDDELAARAGLTEEQVRRARAGRVVASVLSLDATVDGGERARPLEGDARPSTPEAALEEAELDRLLDEAIAGLPDPLGMVIAGHDLGGRPLQDIAADLGVSPARVSQLRNEGLVALRAFFAGQYEEVPEVGADEPGARSRARYLEEMSGRLRAVRSGRPGEPFQP